MYITLLFILIWWVLAPKKLDWFLFVHMTCMLFCGERPCVCELCRLPRYVCVCSLYTGLCPYWLCKIVIITYLLLTPHAYRVRACVRVYYVHSLGVANRCLEYSSARKYYNILFFSCRLLLLISIDYNYYYEIRWIIILVAGRFSTNDSRRHLCHTMHRCISHDHFFSLKCS